MSFLKKATAFVQVFLFLLQPIAHAQAPGSVELMDRDSRLKFEKMKELVSDKIGGRFEQLSTEKKLKTLQRFLKFLNKAETRLTRISEKTFDKRVQKLEKNWTNPTLEPETEHVDTELQNDFKFLTSDIEIESFEAKPQTIKRSEFLTLLQKTKTQLTSTTSCLQTQLTQKSQKSFRSVACVASFGEILLVIACFILGGALLGLGAMALLGCGFLLGMLIGIAFLVVAHFISVGIEDFFINLSLKKEAKSENP